MSSPFHDHIQAALADPDLQIALDANAERRQHARQSAYASLPEKWEIMRERAHLVRANVIDHLDDYLEQFVKQAQHNGLIVHWAADAAQANQIVVEIARQKNAHLAAKSKTMVSEELGLNHALEAGGIQVVETDLGEYIIQLRNERPAHIITPAVHLRRAAVGRTFHEKLGVPLTEDIPEMTATARRALREVFLHADIGISGVNFGVAESGALCILTNEGNGRMVTTLPPVHIALMGIERLVPTYQDLALMLYLLPRSATGQKLTVYTSLLTGPRRTGELDGPYERHLILVDNGRRRLQQSALAEMLYCIRCGACLNACPVFRELSGHAYVDRQGNSSTYPGPMGSILSPGLFGQSEFGHLARASSLCGACKDACPVDIDLPRLLLRVRAGYTPSLHQNNSAERIKMRPNTPATLQYGLRVFTWLATSQRRFALAQRLGGLFSRLLTGLSGRKGWLPLPGWTGWGASKDFPAPAIRPFHARWEELAIELKPASVSEDTSTEAEIVAPSPPEQELKALDRVQRFTTELEALGGKIIACTLENLAPAILAELNNLQINTLQAWNADNLPPDVHLQLQRAGISLTDQPDVALPAGLTGAEAAIAETGSLLVAAGPGKPLTASLLPPIHLAILSAQQIYPSVPEAFAQPHLAQASTAVWISGPSRTADIEMTLTIGVHGPGQLIVFLVNSPEIL